MRNDAQGSTSIETNIQQQSNDETGPRRLLTEVRLAEFASMLKPLDENNKESTADRSEILDDKVSEHQMPRDGDGAATQQTPNNAQCKYCGRTSKGKRHLGQHFESITMANKAQAPDNKHNIEETQQIISTINLRATKWSQDEERTLLDGMKIRGLVYLEMHSKANGRKPTACEKR